MIEDDPRPQLTKIGVGGYQSIKDLQSLEIRKLNILIGANGAGKSNLISFLRLLASIRGRKLQEAVGRAGGPDQLLYYGVKQTPSMWVSVEFMSKTGPGLYFFRLTSTALDTLIFSEEFVDSSLIQGAPSRRPPLGAGHKETLLDEGDNQDEVILQLLAGIQVFHFEDTSETAGFRRQVLVEDNRNLHEDGSNLAAFLYKLRQREPSYYRRIVAAIQKIAPFFEDFELEPRALDPHHILLNWRDRDSGYLFGPHQLSDGTLRAMALTALLAQPANELPGFIVLDEPEIGLHPHAIEILAGLIKRASVHRPVLVATQSVALVNHFNAEDVVTVTREKAPSVFKRQSEHDLAAWLTEYAMGELWEKNLIGGTTFA